jgi:hypothetical protein
MRLQWINEFTDLENEIQSNNALSLMKADGERLEIKVSQR